MTRCKSCGKVFAGDSCPFCNPLLFSPRPSLDSLNWSTDSSIDIEKILGENNVEKKQSSEHVVADVIEKKHIANHAINENHTKRNKYYLDLIKPLSPDEPTMYDAKNLGEMNSYIETVSLLQSKIKTGEFDVFLCHNSEDKLEVKEIGEKLKEVGLLPWLDEWELRPGLPWQEALENEIEQIKSAAVFVGKNGIGPWQKQELNAFLHEFVNRECPVIPVLLRDAPKEPKLPIFLKNFTWIDFRNKRDSIERLIWGITGKRIFDPRLMKIGLTANPNKDPVYRKINR